MVLRYFPRRRLLLAVVRGSEPWLALDPAGDTVSGIDLRLSMRQAGAVCP